MGTAAVIALTSVAGAATGAICFGKDRRVLAVLGLFAGPLIAIGMLSTELLPFLFPLLTGPIFLVLAMMGAAGPAGPESWWSTTASPWWVAFRKQRKLSSRQQWGIAGVSLAFVTVIAVIAATSSG